MRKSIKERRTKFTTATYMREAIKYKALVINENKDYCITIKKYDEMSGPFYLGDVTYLRNGSYLVEITPLNENYNIRFYVDKFLKVVDFYVDITYENGVKYKIPYYVDLYLDIVHYPKDDSIRFEDENELLEALEKGLISKRDYEFAYKIGNKLLNEIKNRQNKYFNLDIVSIIKNSGI